MEDLEKHQKMEQEKRRRQKHAELLQAIVMASKDFKGKLGLSSQTFSLEGNYINFDELQSSIATIKPRHSA